MPTSRGVILRPSPAFTLVEMLVVIVLISVMAGAVMVSFNGRQEGYELTANAKDLAAAIEIASREAKDRHVVCRVAFDRHHRTYAVEELVSPESGEFRAMRGMAGMKKLFARDVRVSGSFTNRGEVLNIPHALVFDSSGESFRGIIELRSIKTGNRERIEVMPQMVHVLPAGGLQAN